MCRHTHSLKGEIKYQLRPLWPFVLALVALRLFGGLPF